MNPVDLVRLSADQSKRGDLNGAIATLTELAGIINNPQIHCTLSSMYREFCNIDEAKKSLDRALDIEDRDSLKLRKALLLPPMMGPREQILEDRECMRSGLEELLENGIRISDPLSQIPNPDFYLAFHGEDDLPLRKLLGKVLRASCPSLTYLAKHCENWRPPLNRRIKIGFISSFFFNHTIGRLNRGLITNLPHDRFEKTVFFIDSIKDNFGQTIANAADNTSILPHDLHAAQNIIADHELDLLYYTDIGMDPLTYFLAFARMAPVQCVTWGHPVSTGLDTIDWFISSETLDSDRTRKYYSEKLAILPDPSVCYPLPVQDTPDNGEKFLGIPEGVHSYLCPQNLFKIHPDFDLALAGILRRDSKGILILQNPPKEEWKRILLKRLQACYAGAQDRVIFLDTVPRAAFLRRMAAANVVLDPFHFGGGNTSLEAIAMGAPLITLPSRFLRCRLTMAWYNVLGIHDCVANNPEEYVEIAVKMATQPELRTEYSTRIKKLLPKLFNAKSAIRSHEKFFLEAINSVRLCEGNAVMC